MDPLERVIRPIVEGQLRSFANDHPEVIAAVDWYKPRPDKRITFVNSVAKRIVRDLTCPTVRARLAAALVDGSYCESGDNAKLERSAGFAGERSDIATCSAPPLCGV